MELSKEFIEEHKLEEAQVKAVSELVASNIATLKGEWDGKANNDAEAILTGASKKITEVTGVSREQGEKIADFVSRSWGTFSEKEGSALKAKIAEYEDKIKNTKGSETLSAEFTQLKETYSELQKKEAAFDELTNSGIQEKYTTLQQELESMTLDVGFSSVKPNFPDTVNSFEAKARWDSFKQEILKENTLVRVEGEWMAINKENEHKQAKLSDLVGKDAELTKLLEGRQQNGMNGKETPKIKVEGIPFEIPENATTAETSKLIKDHLLSKGVPVSSDDYSVQFTAIHKKIKDSRVAA